MVEYRLCKAAAVGSNPTGSIGEYVMTETSNTEQVHVPNEIATGLEAIDKEGGVDVPRSLLDEMQTWVTSVEYDDSVIGDCHRVEEFGEYVVDREHFSGHEDDVTVTTDDRLASIKLSAFLDL